MFLQRTGRIPGDTRQDKRLYFGGSFPWQQIQPTDIVSFVLEYEDDRYPGDWILVGDTITIADLPPLWTITFRLTNNGNTTIILDHNFWILDSTNNSGVTSPVPETLSAGDVATFDFYLFSPALTPLTLALNIGYNSGSTRVVNFDVAFTQIPGYWDPPQNLSATDITPYSFNLNWDASVATRWPVESYDVMMDNNVVGNTTSLIYPLTGLTENTVYHMRVIAVDNHGNRSVPSDELLVTTLVDETLVFNMFYADQMNNIIRLITTNMANDHATTTTIAGIPKVVGYFDGTGTGARFKSPKGGKCNFFGDTSDFIFADNSSIRRCTLAGEVTTIAGDPFEEGYNDDVGVQSRFRNIGGAVLASDGNIYATDTYNNVIRKIDSVGNVTTFAGTFNAPDHLDGNGTDARFFHPDAITIGPDGNLYVSDYGDNNSDWSGIRKITLGGVVSTYLETGGDNKITMLTWATITNYFYATSNWLSNSLISWTADAGSNPPDNIYAGDWKYQPICTFPTGDVIAKGGNLIMYWITGNISDFPNQPGGSGQGGGGYIPIAGNEWDYGYTDGNKDIARFGWVGR